MLMQQIQTADVLLEPTVHQEHVLTAFVDQHVAQHITGLSVNHQAAV